MASYNRAIIVGNLTRAPELRSLQSGTTIAELGLAVNDRRRGQNGDYVEETSFFDVTVWGRNAEVVRDYTQKGSPILVEGRLKQETWEQEGQKRSKVKIVAERIVLLSFNNNGQASDSDNRQMKSYAATKRDGDHSQPINRGNGYTNVPKYGSPSGTFNQEMEADLPF